MLKILNSQSKTVTGAAIVIAAATLLSRVVGIARDRVFAHYFGAGVVMDAYYAAFKIPDLIYNLLIVGALTAGFIPTFTKIFYKTDTKPRTELYGGSGTGDKTAAWKLCNNIINIIGVSLLVLCGLGMVFTPWLSKIIAPGFTGNSRELAITFTRIMFFSPFLLGISMVLGGVLQSLRHFLLYSIAPVFYNLGIIFGALVLVPWLGISGLAWGVVLGATLHSGAQLYGAYHNGYRWQWHFNLRDPETRLIGKLMLPRTLGLAMTQLNAVIVTVLASLLPIGSVAVYNYANNLQGVPTGLIGIPFALAVFPLLSTMAAEADGEGFVKHLSEITRQILFLIIPISVIILLLRAQIVRVILGSGAFDWAATVNTADTLAFFSLGLFANSLIPLYARAFYALANTKTPFVIGVIAELVSIISALLLMKPLGVAGLALASTIGAVLNSVMLFFSLRQITEHLEGERLLSFLYRIAGATIVMALTVQFLKYPLAKILDLNRFWGILLHGLISGIVGLVVYGLICRMLMVEEMMQIQSSLKKRWLRLWHVPAGIDEAEKL